MPQIGIAARAVSSSVTVGSPRRSDVPAVRYTAANLPAAFDAVADVEIPRKVWSAWIPRFEARQIIRPLRDDERAALEARKASLAPALAPYAGGADAYRGAAALGAMFDGFRSMRVRGENAMGRLDTAMRVLKYFPAWAVEEACASIQRDGYQVHDREKVARTERHWPPSDPEIADVVRLVVKTRDAALASATALLSASVES